MANNNKKGFWSGLLGTGHVPKERDRFSLEELARLNEVLQRNSYVTDANREAVVEALRSMAELMIWGDQHDPKFFEFFLEANLLRHFTQLLRSWENRRGDMAKQVLQTLSILIQNIKSTTAIFYLFSNNHINEIVGMRFDFEDDEVLGYYINLLKTISLKLDSRTVQFFYHDGEQSSFPLYTEAIKFVNHRDGMVRAAVRTLTLNVYGIQDRAVQAFVVAVPAANYFNELAILIAQQCQALDAQLPNLAAGTSAAVYGVENLTSEIEDLLSYCNDILDTGEGALMKLLQQCLWETFLAPVLFWPLTAKASPQSASATGQARAAALGSAGGAALVSALCALYVAERLLRVVTHPATVNLIAAALLLGHLQGPGVAGATLDFPPENDILHRRPRTTSADSQPGAPVVAAQQASREGGAAEAAACDMAAFVDRLVEGPATHVAFAAAFQGDQPCLAAAAVHLLAALIQHRNINPDLLDAAGLLPQRRKKTRELLDQLTAPGNGLESSNSAEALFSGPLYGTGGRAGQASIDAEPSTSGRSEKKGPRSFPLHDFGGQDGSPTPPPGLPAQLSAEQAEALREALGSATAALLKEASGLWCDALALLLHTQWPATGASLLSAPPGSTPAAVQTWGQASQLLQQQEEEGGTAGTAALASRSPSSAEAARSVFFVLQRFVALYLLQKAIAGQDTGGQAPLPLVTEAQIKAKEVREDSVVDLSLRLPCSVSFQRGKERSVFFTITGLPEVEWKEGPDAEEERSAAVASLCMAVPTVVLAVPMPSNHLGAVVSVAPLMGAQAAIDRNHKRWLHLDVRPPVRGLLKSLQASTPATVSHQLDQQLVDGHWVLAFPDPAAALQAKQLLEERAAALRILYARVLQPLLVPTGSPVASSV